LYGGYPTEFAGSNQNPKKKYRNIKSTKQNEYFPKKSFYEHLKNVEEPKTHMRATRQNLQAQPKILKKLSEPIKTKIFPKKYMFSTLKV
jgi:hypothetical protein